MLVKTIKIRDRLYWLRNYWILMLLILTTITFLIIVGTVLYNDLYGKEQFWPALSAVSSFIAIFWVVVGAIFATSRIKSFKYQMHGNSFFKLYEYILDNKDLNFLIKEVLDENGIYSRIIDLKDKPELKELLFSYFETLGMLIVKKAISIDYAFEYGRTTIVVYRNILDEYMAFRESVYGRYANEYFNNLYFDIVKMFEKKDSVGFNIVERNIEKAMRKADLELPTCAHHKKKPSFFSVYFSRVKQYLLYKMNKKVS